MNYIWLERSGTGSYRWVCTCGSKGFRYLLRDHARGLASRHAEQHERSFFIHPAWVCEGRNCTFHNPSEHALSEAPIHVRMDPWAYPLCERICEHGVGHPDPDSIEFLRTQDPYRWDGVHGCCGCCTQSRRDTEDEA